jgi:hypothetical protein
LIAKTTENSNLSSGYNITLASANNYLLKSATAGASDVKYNAFFNGVGRNSVSRDFPAFQGPVFTSMALKDGKTDIDVSHDLQMSYVGTPATAMVAGSYTDTLTIQAN